jgi:hypothetical protein
MTMSEDLTRGLPNEGTEQILTLLRGVDARLTGLEERLTGLEERVDRRLMETRPIWEQVLSRLDVVDTRLDGLDQRIDNLGLDMRAGFRRLERQMAQLAQEGVVYAD